MLIMWKVARNEWYLPHHPVVNPNKPGKVRRVLNGAAKFHGASLNKSLLTGPDLLQNLIYVLLRFRQHPFAVSADIEGMFLQVEVLPCDQPSLRFLWREDPTSNVVVHQYTRHIFGAKDSPTCANYALERTARDNAKEYPEAAKAVPENFYMDNYLDSVESPERALIRLKELVHLFHLGGFKLTKFVSNVPDLADRIDGSAQSTEPKVIVSSKEESMHVLGLKWDHNNDTLVVSRGAYSTITKSLTQRLVLSLVSKFYDPIGLVAPFTVGARLILKDIWRVNGQSWDDELPKDTFDRFLARCIELPRLAEITIPRSFFSGGLVGVCKSLSYDADLKSTSLLNTAVQKLPPNLKESWSLFTVKKHWVKPTLLDFNDWLKEKAEAHDLMKQTSSKLRTEDNTNSVVKTKVASRTCC